MKTVRKRFTMSLCLPVDVELVCAQSGDGEITIESARLSMIQDVSARAAMEGMADDDFDEMDRLFAAAEESK